MSRRQACRAAARTRAKALMRTARAARPGRRAGPQTRRHGVTLPRKRAGGAAGPAPALRPGPGPRARLQRPAPVAVLEGGDGQAVGDHDQPLAVRALVRGVHAGLRRAFPVLRRGLGVAVQRGPALALAQPLQQQPVCAAPRAASGRAAAARTCCVWAPPRPSLDAAGGQPGWRAAAGGKHAERVPRRVCPQGRQERWPGRASTPGCTRPRERDRHHREGRAARCRQAGPSARPQPLPTRPRHAPSAPCPRPLRHARARRPACPHAGAPAAQRGAPTRELGTPGTPSVCEGCRLTGEVGRSSVSCPSTLPSAMVRPLRSPSACARPPHVRMAHHCLPVVAHEPRAQQDRVWQAGMLTARS